MSNGNIKRLQETEGIQGLVNEMLDALPILVWQSSKTTFADLEIGGGQFIREIVRRLRAAGHSDENIKGRVHGFGNAFIVHRLHGFPATFQATTSDSRSDAVKFDVIVGNPPYNPPSREGKSGRHTLYDKFLRSALLQVNEGGYICYVHPPLWRKPGAKMGVWDLVKDLQFLRLEIYNTKDGMRTFGAGTRYDWYVLQNTPVSKPTPVRDEEGNEVLVDFREWNWLPNGGFEEIKQILASEKDSLCPVIFSRSAYGSDKNWISANTCEKFKFPLVHATNKSGPRLFWSSRNDKGHFGVPKVIFGDSGVNEPLIDLGGEFGVTQHAIAVEVSDIDEAQQVKNALMNSRFSRLLSLAIWSNFMIDYRLFRCFRRDWYLQFQD